MNPQKLAFDRHYHLFNFGADKCNIFREERNYIHFMKLYRAKISPIADTIAYCLLKNHYHLFVRIKSLKEIQRIKNLAEPLQNILVKSRKMVDRQERTEYLQKLPSKAFADFFNAYASSFNCFYERQGGLFNRPFGRKEIKTTEYANSLIRYIHKNPEHHGFVAAFEDWPYSSFMKERSLPKQIPLSLPLLWDVFESFDEYKQSHFKEIPEKILNELAQFEVTF